MSELGLPSRFPSDVSGVVSTLQTCLSEWGLPGNDATIAFGSGSVFGGRSGLNTVLVPLVDGQNQDVAQRTVRSAGVVVLLDPAELGLLGGALDESRVLLSGIPRPSMTARDEFNPSPGEHPLYASLWSALGGAPPTVWVWGRGVWCLIRAVTAWSCGFPVVAAPGTPRHSLLTSGGTLFARSGCEMVEASSFLRDSPALARETARRGKMVCDGLPTVVDVCTVIAEAIEVARIDSSNGG